MLTGKEQEASTSSAAASPEAAPLLAAATQPVPPCAGAPMAGHYAPFSLDGADISPERTDLSAIAYLETFRSGVAKFFGEPDKDGRSARNWVEEVMGFRRECLAALPNQAFAAAIRSKLDGVAKKRLAHMHTTSPARLLGWIRDAFPLPAYQRALHERIETGAAFEGCTRDDVCMRVTFYLEELEGYTLGVSILATAVKAMLPEIWRKVGEHPCRMTTEAFAAVLQLVAEELRKDLEVQLEPFGVMTRASAASVSAQALPDSEATVSSSVAIKLTKGLRWLQKKIAEQGKEIAELKEALARLSVSSATSVACPTCQPTPGCAPDAGDAQAPSASTATLAPPESGESWRDDRQQPHWVKLQGVCIGGESVDAVRGSDSAKSFITSALVKRFGLRVREFKGPKATASWPSMARQMSGCVRVRVSAENGYKRWMEFAVIDREQPWDVLIGAKHAAVLEDQAATPAVRGDQQQGSAIDVTEPLAD